MAYVEAIGASGKLAGPPRAHFDFADLASGERWTLRINDGPVPWWILAPDRRVPGTAPSAYLAAGRLLLAGGRETIGDCLDAAAPLYARLWRPVLLAALNTDPREASARLAAAVLRETLLRGGAACRPLVAVDGLGAAFVGPALSFLERRGVRVHLDHRLRGLSFSDARVAALEFGDGETVTIGRNDSVVLAVPAAVATELVPGLVAPQAFRAIVNAHFRIRPPPGFPRITGVVNGLTEWLFAFEARLSLTISAADRLLDTPREELADRLWREVAVLTGLPAGLPPWQIIKERRATIAALPEQEPDRPGPRSAWANLFLAGDWTATGLPATIEGAIRSGHRAAALARGAAEGTEAPAVADRTGDGT
jgi:squalene-associated FAD-dependent desaturase